MHRRTAERVLSARLDETAVVRLSGPRAAGKTTSCVAEATRRGGSIVRLDDPDVLVAVAFDPSGYLAGLPAPILIDEYHRVPEVLDVIKADLSRAPATPGRWLLCGSVSIGAVATAANSLGGRLTDVAMGTLTLDERNDLAEPKFLLRLVSERSGFLRGWRPKQAFERAGLLAEAVRGGFPLVTDRELPASRRRGLMDWVEASAIADGAAVGGVRNTENLRRMLRLYASSTASVTPKDRPTAETLGIDRRTVASYRDVLAGLYVTWDLPAFVPGNAAGQVTRSPKLHLVDSGLAAALAGRDQDPALDRDPGFAGALIETMVANDLRVQAGALEAGARLYHYREDSAEVDLVVEDGDGMVTGIEIKLSPNPRDGDLAGMRRLAKACGARWASGIVLCRVPAGRLTDDGITLAPIEAVWQV